MTFFVRGQTVRVTIFFLKSYISRTDTNERFIENIDINNILLQHSQPSIFAFKVQIQPPIKLAGEDNEA